MIILSSEASKRLLKYLLILFTIDKSEFYSDVKEHVLTEANKQKAKKSLKIAGIVFGIILLVDPISFIIYAAVFGLPQ